jgi:hypothetical protein
MKILHLGDSRRYCQQFAIFINKYFNKSEHDFILSGLGRYTCTKKGIDPENVTYTEWRIPLEVFKLYTIPFSDYDKIILHGLFNWRVFFPFPLKRIDMKKVYWKFWGADLYFYRYRSNTIRDSFIELVRRRNIKKIQHIITSIKQEYELAKRIYKTPAAYHYGFYPNTIDYSTLDAARNRKHQDRAILLGNSSNPSNNHLEILKWLHSFKRDDFRIICPLSYGNDEYAEKVAAYGHEKFGSNFHPLFKYLDSKEYAQLLASVDVGIFNHQRQQGIGTIYALLYLGKKVFIRSDITTWQFFKEKHIQVYDTSTLHNSSLHELFEKTREVQNKNRDIVRHEFSEETCAHYWAQIFNEEVE